MSKVITALAAIPLGEAAVIDGVHVIRRSLLGFQVAGLPDLVEAAEAAARIATVERDERPASPLPQVPSKASALQKRPIVRVLVCTRCGGDGLGRRNRGACGLCHGPGIQVVMPLGGFSGAPPEELASAIDQALTALSAARRPQALESLLTLLGAALRFAPPAVQQRSLSALRRGGFEAAATALAALVGAPRAA